MDKSDWVNGALGELGFPLKVSLIEAKDSKAHERDKKGFTAYVLVTLSTASVAFSSCHNAATWGETATLTFPQVCIYENDKMSVETEEKLFISWLKKRSEGVCPINQL